MKRIGVVLCLWLGGMAVSAQTNLLSNSSFEDYSCNMLGCSWTDWSMPLGLCSVETEDKIDGDVSLRAGGSMFGYLDNMIALSDEDYEPRRIFEITLSYKVLAMPEEGELKSDCYWEPQAGGDADEMKKHDADLLQRVVANTASTEWETVVIETSKPAKSSKIRIRMEWPKSAIILFDAFSVVETDRMVPPEETPVEPQEGDTTAPWTHNFNWDISAPLTYMDEGFERAAHNQPLAVKGWQNVAADDARPWWGYDASRTNLFDENFRCAKATAYQYGKAHSDYWEMWLVTPALDYKNTEKKVFAFSIMGEYLPETESETMFDIYYIDPSQPATMQLQNLTESFAIPWTSAEDYEWRTFLLDLTPFAETVGDVFFMAFRYSGPNGREGAPTYYIDDVSWGKEEPVKGIETISDEGLSISGRKLLRNGQLLILRAGKTYNVLGTLIK